MNEISLKTLKVIDALVTHKNIRRAAESVNKSSSSINYLLKELRKTTGHKLFIRSGRGLIPDENAFALQEKYHKLTKHLYDVSVEKQSIFNREVVISTYSLIEFYLSQHLYARNIENGKYRVQFKSLCLSDEERILKLRNSEVDIDIGSQLPDESAIISKFFFSSKLKVFASKNNNEIGDTLTIDDWHKCEHADWSRVDNIVEKACDNKEGLIDLLKTRNIKYESSNLMNIIVRCAQSNMIIALPEVFENILENIFPLQSYDMPASCNFNFSCYVHYHRSLANDEGVADILNILCDQ